MSNRPSEAIPLGEESDNPLLKTPTSGQNLTKTLSPLSGDGPFEKRFDALCRDVIKPALLRVVKFHVERGGLPLLDVVDGPGPVQRANNDYFVDNRRVILQVRPVASLWFVAWEPEIILQRRRGAAGPIDVHSLDEITPEFVEKVAREFLDSSSL